MQTPGFAEQLDPVAPFGASTSRPASMTHRWIDGVEGMSITELAISLGITRFRASHHLGILREAGIARTTKHGTRTINELATGPLFELWDWLTHVTEEPPK
ncbi:ArsR/SmtB family transcription factor [Microbacterium sp. Yaish 1]|uniref:ArsR/SmtB family transcription factor n=1 Tax=Microbacterium sp. Yaish 1 TaxID=2025014 RepID=UPI000B93A456|nr:helix-turn-helix domain-containing protein [Microbacterium sp. Yaish 1]OYC98403.1 hypothetical protein CI089_08030 [Microbacterium sp. Yaish 1]